MLKPSLETALDILKSKIQGRLIQRDQYARKVEVLDGEIAALHEAEDVISRQISEEKKGRQS